MRAVFLIFAWVTPAMIAGMLGWPGIWGTGSALAGFLIPLPVAGGALHVPSFLVVCAVVLGGAQVPASIRRYIPVAAAAALLAAIALQIDFERLTNWLFSDYQPSGSPLRLDGNAVMLFVATDAFWVLVWSFVYRYPAASRLWLGVPLVPIVIVAIALVRYQAGGPVFDQGRSLYADIRGDEFSLVFTSASTYDEQLFRDWFEQSNIRRPWTDVNSEHVAVIFTSSRQLLAMPIAENITEQNTIATLCLFEEDRSSHLHAGYHDCFAERENTTELMQRLAASARSGFGKDVDQWLARAMLCEDVALDTDSTAGVARIDLCYGLRRNYPQDLLRFKKNHGQTSRAVRFFEREAVRRDIAPR